jgi:hypothetical protein
MRLLRASIVREASACGKRAHELSKQALERINADFDVDNPSTPPRASQKLIAAATLLRAMPAPSTPEARNLHRETQALMEQAAVQQARVRRPAFARRGACRTTGAHKALRCQFTRAARQGGPPVKAGRWSGSGSLTRVGRPKTATLATSSTPGRRATRKRRWRQATTHGEVGTTTAERTARRRWSPRGPACSAGRSARRASLNASANPRIKYTGETDPHVWLNDYRLACQLGGATTDEVIIRNLPLHLADSARTWLEHVSSSQIHNWDDLVRTFVLNF